MSFPYKHVILIGATSGIGKAMGDHFISQGIKVTAVGRRKDRLDSFVSSHGPEKASSEVLDIVDLDKIPAFVENTIKKSPDIDCVFLNAGTQNSYNFANPPSVDLSTFNQEMTTNFTSFVALTHAFLPHLLGQDKPTSLVYTGTHISLVPVATLPAYSASKAALDAFIMCIRAQLASTKTSVYHISPGPVQTELHNARMGADKGQAFGMPLGQFVDETWKGLDMGTKNILVGLVGGSSMEQLVEMAEKKEEAFNRMTELLKKIGAPL